MVAAARILENSVNLTSKRIAGVAAAAVLTATLALSATQATATTLVDVELHLLLDTSGSISPEDFNAQRNAYLGAFNRIKAAADAGTITLPRFALQITAFSGLGQQLPLVAWTLVDEPGKLNQVRAQLGSFPFQPFTGLTNIASAVEYAVDQFRSNAFDGTRQIIDLSTDRMPNETRNALEGDPGAPTAQEIADDLIGVRDNALATDGIICIGNSSFCFPAGGGGVEQMNVILFNADDATADFYTNNLVGGDGSFLLNGKLTSALFGSEFEDELTRKIVAELTRTPIAEVSILPAAVSAAVPLPAAGWMLVAGIGGLLAFGRRHGSA